MQRAAREDERRARRRRGDQAIAQADLLAERQCGWFLHKNRIGSGFDREAVQAVRVNQSTETR